MNEIFMNVAKNDFCPDEIDTSISPKLTQVRRTYDQKFNDLVRWFWEEVDKATTVEEKKILYEQLSDICKDKILAAQNKIKEDIC